MIDWKAINSPDYFNSACTHTYSGVPLNRFGSCYSKSGNNYVGIGMYTSDNEYKEYIYQQLSVPLQSGTMYCLNLYISRADRITYAIKNIGAFFSNNIQSVGSSGFINTIPQVLNQNGFIIDTTNWIQVQGCFIANGGEQYITIGNFNSNSNTDTLRIPSTNQLTNGSGSEFSYYYIDDITLLDQTSVGFNELSNGASVSVYPNPANHILNISIGPDSYRDIKENTEIKIYNQLGELVFNETLTTQNSSIKTHHLQSGVYFYNILSNDKVLKTDKLVIIK